MRTICLHTKHSPFYSLYYGYHPSFEPRVSDNTTVPAAGDLARQLKQLHLELRAELRHAQDLQAKYYNTKVLASPTYHPDQLVCQLLCLMQHGHITQIMNKHQTDHDQQLQ